MTFSKKGRLPVHVQRIMTIKLTFAKSDVFAIFNNVVLIQQGEKYIYRKICMYILHSREKIK